jgi:hypothetical protein
MNLAEWMAQERRLSERLRAVETLCEALLVPSARTGRGAFLDPMRIEVSGDGACRVRSGAYSGFETGYRAPEVVGRGTVSLRADVFVLGILAYELLAGEHPFGGDPVDGARPSALSDRWPETPAAVSDAVMACLQTAPESRLKDASVLLAAARDWRQAPGESGNRRFANVLIDRTLVTELDSARPTAPAPAPAAPAARAPAGAAEVMAPAAAAVERTAAPPPPPAAATTAPAPPGTATAPVARPAPARASRAPLAVGVTVLAAAAVAGVVWWQRTSRSPVAAPSPVADAAAAPAPGATGAFGAAPPPAEAEVPDEPTEEVVTIVRSTPTPGASAPATTTVARAASAATPPPLTPAEAPPVSTPPAEEALSAPPPATEAAAPVRRPASISVLAPPAVGRSRSVLVDVRGVGLRPDHRLVVSRNGRPVTGISVTPYKYVDGGLLIALVKVEADATLGAYEVSLIDSDGALSNVRTLRVDK